MTRALAGICLAPFVPLLAAAGQEAELIDEGRPAATILIPANPLPGVEYAADELIRHIEAATGEPPDLAQDRTRDARPDGPFISLGRTRALAESGVTLPEFGINGFLIEVRGGNLFIAGDDDDGRVFEHDGPVWTAATQARLGTLFGVYDLLENRFGVRWLFPGELGTHVPAVYDLSLPPGFRKVHEPQLRYARLQDAWMAGMKEGWNDPSERERFLKAQATWLRRHRFAASVPIYGAHSFGGYWERFHEAHPEYFNLLPNGKRDLDPCTTGNDPDDPMYRLITMCVSNPDLHGQVIEDWLSHGGPESGWLGCGENDAMGRCTCVNCRAWDATPVGTEKMLEEFRPVPDVLIQQYAPAQLVSMEKAAELFHVENAAWPLYMGSLSDRYARFVKAVYELARQHCPDVQVSTLAYANYWDGPVETELNSNIWVQAVPTMLYPWTEFNRRTSRQQWRRWRNSGAALVHRPNYPLAGHNMPLNYARRFGEDFAWYYRNGMRASDFCALKGQFATQGLNLYVLARLHNAPGKEVDAIMEEYYAGFGAASEAVRAYFEYLEEVDLGVTNEHFRQAVAQRATEKMPLSPRWATWLYYHRVADLIYTGEVFDRAFELLRRARERAGGDETLLAKIDYLAQGLENSRLTAAIGPVYDHYLRTGEKEPLRHTSERLDAYRATIEPALTGNMGMVYFAESMTWRPVLAEEADE